MKKKLLLSLAVALLVSGCGPTETKAVKAQSETSSDSSHKIIAYYFYTTKRCPSCYKIENYSKEAIEAGFAGALKAGQLEWRMVNTDEPENRHFVEDFSLFTKSLILVEMKDGNQVRWKNCGMVWQLLNSKDKFQDYVRREVRAYLSGT